MGVSRFMQTSFIKLLDNYLGRFLSLALGSQLPGHFLEPVKILLIRPGGIGDALLLAAAIDSIKKTYPQICITVLAERRNAAVFPLVPGVDEVFRYDRPCEFFRALRGRYDAVIDTEQWYRLSAVAARLVRAPIKIGFDTNERRRMFTHGIRYDQNAYEPDSFSALLKPLGVDSRQDDGAVTVSLPEQAVIRARQLLQPLGSDAFVAMFPGASIDEKRWGAGRFRLVAKRLSEGGFKVVVVGGREDRKDGDIIAGGAGLNLAGRTTLAETAAVIARSRLVVSGDSGVLHLAAGLDIPTVSLFGPSSVAKWAPRGDKHIVLNHFLSCSPCSRFGSIPSCPLDARCIADISPDEVIDAIGRLLLLPR